MSVALTTIQQHPVMNELLVPGPNELDQSRESQSRRQTARAVCFSETDTETDNEIDEDDVLDSEDDEDVVEMAPLKKNSKSEKKFMVDQDQHENVTSNLHSPVLRSLFDETDGNMVKGKKEWNAATDMKPAMSHDKLTEDVLDERLEMILRKSKCVEKRKLSLDSQVKQNSSRKKDCNQTTTANKLGRSLSCDDETYRSTSDDSHKRTGSLNEASNRSTSPVGTTSTGESSNESPKPKNMKRTIQTKSGSKTGSRHVRSDRNGNVKNIRLISTERLAELKNIVDVAVREHKVYSMSGAYPSVRRALKQRGWVEKLDSEMKPYRRRETNFTSGLFYEPCENNWMTNEANVINRLLRNITEDLCWLNRPYNYAWKYLNKDELVNRIPKAFFSNKVGLCNALRHVQWYMEPGISCTQFPRTYNISYKDELDAFVDDFRLTACICVLKWLTMNYKHGGETSVRTPDGKVDNYTVEFAMRRCAEFVKTKQHEDIDMLEVPTIWEHQWDHFLTQYYKLVHEGDVLKKKDDPTTIVMVRNAQSMLNLVKEHWPQFDIEGIFNMWIMKPGNRCCGHGIVIKNQLEHVMNMINPSITKETRYVVQKYIEKPLLIYKTKFDIRQWFLVTSVYPLTVWMYKECYLRFCSVPFSLRNPHESIHLCNNAVQRRYKNAKRDKNLPDENMWDNFTFKTYLRMIGMNDVWDDIIYPGMRESFVGALLASQDYMERRKNCFELYGADFMISEKLTDGPWLIEINSNPAMDSSSSITARLCPQVLEDIVKVVIDRRNDRNADTGSFELVFKQNCPPVPPYLGMSLAIKGTKVCKAPNENKSLHKRSKNGLYDKMHDSDSDTSEDLNIVQKRCITDFMQPIKNLKETIRLSEENVKMAEVFKMADEMASYGSDESDSEMCYDTESSQSSLSNTGIKIQGKEMELKTKYCKPIPGLDSSRSDKKNSETSDGEQLLNKEKMKLAKRKKKKDTINWVKKNIRQLEDGNMKRNLGFEELKLEQSKEILLDEIFPKKKPKLESMVQQYCASDRRARENMYEEMEMKFRAEISKILSAGECKKFLCKLSPRISQWKEDVMEKKDDKCLEKNYLDKLIFTALWKPGVEEKTADDGASKPEVTNTQTESFINIKSIDSPQVISLPLSKVNIPQSTDDGRINGNPSKESFHSTQSELSEGKNEEKRKRDQKNSSKKKNRVPKINLKEEKTRKNKEEKNKAKVQDEEKNKVKVQDEGEENSKNSNEMIEEIKNTILNTHGEILKRSKFRKCPEGKIKTKDESRRQTQDVKLKCKTSKTPGDVQVEQTKQKHDKTKTNSESENKKKEEWSGNSTSTVGVKQVNTTEKLSELTETIKQPKIKTENLKSPNRNSGRETDDDQKKTKQTSEHPMKMMSPYMEKRKKLKESVLKNKTNSGDSPQTENLILLDPNKKETAKEVQPRKLRSEKRREIIEKENDAFCEFARSLRIEQRRLKDERSFVKEKKPKNEDVDELVKEITPKNKTKNLTYSEWCLHNLEDYLLRVSEEKDKRQATEEKPSQKNEATVRTAEKIKTVKKEVKQKVEKMRKRDRKTPVTISLCSVSNTTINQECTIAITPVDRSALVSHYHRNKTKACLEDVECYGNETDSNVTFSNGLGIDLEDDKHESRNLNVVQTSGRLSYSTTDVDRLEFTLDTDRKQSKEWSGKIKLRKTGKGSGCDNLFKCKSDIADVKDDAAGIYLPPSEIKKQKYLDSDWSSSKCKNKTQSVRRSIEKILGCKKGSESTDPYLVITRESGSVSRVTGLIPAIKQRSRPVLPNSISGHDFKMLLSQKTTTPSV